MDKELFIWGIDLSPNLIAIRKTKLQRVFVYLQDAGDFAEAMEQHLQICRGLMASGATGDKVPSIYLRTPNFTLAGTGRFFSRQFRGGYFGYKLILQDQTRVIFELRSSNRQLELF